MKGVAQHTNCGDESDFSVSIDVGQIRLDERGFTRFDKGAQVVECRLMLSGEALYPMRPRSDRRLYNDVAADLGQLAVRHVFVAINDCRWNDR